MARFSVAALLFASLCAACGGGQAIGPHGGAGSGGRAVDSAAQANGSNAGSDGGDDQASARSDAGGDDLAKDGRGAGDAGPPRLASNGVAIPSPRLALASGVDPCNFLELESVACSTTSACAPFTCDCGGQPLVFQGCAGANITCVTGLSCPFACALGPDAIADVTACMYGIHSFGKPACKSDADCGQPGKCLFFPNTTVGECVDGKAGSPCLADADCQPQMFSGFPLPAEAHACVVAANGVGSCEGLGLEGATCNTDAQCSTGRCLITSGAFVGDCHDTGQGHFCFTRSDCQQSPDPMECVALSRSGDHVCSTRAQGAFCEGGADCASGFCVNSRCTTGAPDAPCNADSDCLGFCGAQGNCSDGTEGKECRRDGSGCVHGTRCAANLCEADGVPCKLDGDCYTDFFCVDSACRSGMQGAPCKSSSQCHVGSCISNSICSVGRFGDQCSIDGDCQGFCLAGQCTGGVVGATCRADKSDCAVGLQCTSGMCQGDGVACKVDADCYMGLFACVNAVCSSRQIGSTCNSTHSCYEGVCGSNSICVIGSRGDPCVADSDCQAAYFCGGRGHCSDGSAGTECRLDGSGCMGVLPCSAMICPGLPDAGV